MVPKIVRNALHIRLVIAETKFDLHREGTVGLYGIAWYPNPESSVKVIDAT